MHTRAEVLTIAAMCIAIGCVNAEDDAQTDMIDQNVEFELKRLHASPSGRDDKGEFKFRIKRSSDIDVPVVFGTEARGRTITLHFVGYEVSRGGKWVELDVGYCGIVDYIPISSTREYTLIVDLGAFHRQKRPVTVRVSFEDKMGRTYRSRPFKLEPVEPKRQL